MNAIGTGAAGIFVGRTQARVSIMLLAVMNGQSAATNAVLAVANIPAIAAAHGAAGGVSLRNTLGVLSAGRAVVSAGMAIIQSAALIRLSAGVAVSTLQAGSAESLILHDSVGAATRVFLIVARALHVAAAGVSASAALAVGTGSSALGVVVSVSMAVLLGALAALAAEGALHELAAASNVVGRAADTLAIRSRQVALANRVSMSAIMAVCLISAAIIGTGIALRAGLAGFTSRNNMIVPGAFAGITSTIIILRGFREAHGQKRHHHAQRQQDR